MRSLFWVFLAVLLLLLAFPPADLGWLGWVALWPWCRLVSTARGWRLFAWGYAGGVVLLGFGCEWLRQSAWVNLLGMVVVEALYYGAFAVVLRVLLVHRRWSAVVALPGAWVAMEFGRRHIPFDGFPWLFLGYTQHSTLLPLQVAELGGVFGLGALLAFTAGAFHELTAPGADRRRGAVRAVPAALLVLAAFVYGAVRLDSLGEAVPGPRVLVVQPNIPQVLKNSQVDKVAAIREDASEVGADAELAQLPSWLQDRQWAYQGEIVARHVRWTRRGLRAAEGPIDLVVWPETMFPMYTCNHGAGDPADLWRRGEIPVTHEVAEDHENQLLEYLKPVLKNSWFLVGVVSYLGDVHRGDDQQWNSAILYGEAGERLSVYDKRFLVPGGEYLPLVGGLPDSWQGTVHEWIRGVTGGWLPRLSAGTNSPVMDVKSGAATAKAGVSICYDIAYPSHGREAVEAGAEFLLNISNEAWFPDSAEFAQYTAIASVRAVEVRRSIVRCANSGTSALIDPYGRVEALEGTAGERDGFAGCRAWRPGLHHEITLYARWGDWPAWMGLVSTLFLLSWPRRRSA